MTNRYVKHANLLGDQLWNLSHEISQIQAVSTDFVLERACGLLAAISPFSAAGVFTPAGDQNSLYWLHISNPEVQSMRRALDGSGTDLSQVISGTRAVQFTGASDGSEHVSYYSSVPTGPISGSPTGLLVQSNRELAVGEIELLNLVGLMLGLRAENARLSGMVESRQDVNRVARLLGLVAHELRTPLTSIRGNVQLALMAQQRGQSERVGERLDSAIGGIDDMTNLVQTLLDVSRLERGTFHLEREQSDLATTIRGALGDVQGERGSEAKPVQLNEFDSRSVSHDERVVRQAICYLLNAIFTCTGEDNAVDVTSRIEDALFGVVFGYQGKRMPDRDLLALSSPLDQAHTSGEKADDLSLELAYVRGIVRQHGGQIDLRLSDSGDAWQEVTIWLPIR